MSPALIVAAHHVRRLVRRPGLVLVLLAIPVTLAAIEYAAFGRSIARGALPPIKVLLLDEDQSLLSRMVPQLFSTGPMKGKFDVETVTDREVARAQFRRNQASALVVVPKGFQEAALAGTRTELTVEKNPVQGIMPEVVEAVAEVGAMVANRLLAEVRAPIQRIREMAASGRDASDAEMLDIARGFGGVGRRLGSLTGLERAKVTVVRPDGQKQAVAGVDPATFFATVFPGLVIFALLFVSQALSARLLRDRVRGLQRRIAVAAVSGASVIAGGIAYVVASLFVILVALAAVGRFAFGISLREPLALVLTAAGLAAFAAGLHLAIVSSVRSDRAAGFVGTAVVLVISLLGGAFIPVAQYPAFLRGVASVVPNGAAQHALVQVLANGRGLGDVLAAVITTWCWAALTLGIAVFFERRRLVTP